MVLDIVLICMAAYCLRLAGYSRTGWPTYTDNRLQLCIPDRILDLISKHLIRYFQWPWSPAACCVQGAWGTRGALAKNVMESVAADAACARAHWTLIV